MPSKPRKPRKVKDPLIYEWDDAGGQGVHVLTPAERKAHLGKAWAKHDREVRKEIKTRIFTEHLLEEVLREAAAIAREHDLDTMPCDISAELEGKTVTWRLSLSLKWLTIDMTQADDDRHNAMQMLMTRKSRPQGIEAKYSKHFVLDKPK